MSTIADRLKNLYDSMVIANSVTNEFTQALPDCYEAVEAKGGTLPEQQTVINLTDSINSIPSAPVPPEEWLNSATKESLITSFGQNDGTAIINSTETYLNEIAENDLYKAENLASYINRDPMFVCSLDLHPEGVTMPIRSMYTDGNAYSITGIVPNSTTKIYTAVRWESEFRAYSYIFGSNGSAGKTSYYFFGINNTNWYTEIIGSNYNFGTVEKDMRYIIEYTTQYAKINGTQYNFTGTGVLGANKACIAIGVDLSETLLRYDNAWIGSIDYLTVETNGEIVGEFLPFYNDSIGIMTWLDIKNGSFIAGKNTWTEKFYLPDGTEWTPNT